MGSPIVRFEIGCRDNPAARQFYETVFGWKTIPNPMGTDVDTGSGEDLNGAIVSLGHEPHQYVLFYMGVDDIDKTVEEISAQGGEVTIGPVDIPGGQGRFAWFKDPEGNMLGIYQQPDPQ